MTTKLTSTAIKLLEGKNFAFLATILPDGAPHVAPVWIDHDGDLIIVNTAIGRVKQKNMERDRRVALSIAGQDNPYEKVVIRGKVTMQTTEGAEQHIDKMAKKYTGASRYQKSGPNERRIIVKIEPLRIT